MMKILLVDDNAEITEMVSFYLQSNGAECKVANTGRGGLEEIRRGKYDVVILDLAIPEFSGFDVFNALKKEGLIESNNIVIFTASSISEENVESMVRDGAKLVLRKPVSLDDLQSVIATFDGSKRS
jgi:CheY-like chemotaxis protein